MSITTFVLGESGSGKTSSLRNIDPARALLIQSVPKPLPFRSAGWQRYNKASKTGSIIFSDQSAIIEGAMRKIDREIVIIDDWQYILANEFMVRSGETGFAKFTDIGRHAWDSIVAATTLAADRRVYVLMHTTQGDDGITRAKTIGRLLDEKITIEGMVTIVLRAVVTNGVHMFSTQNSGHDTVKAPIGMFEEALIDNDLAAVDEAICRYYGIGC